MRDAKRVTIDAWFETDGDYGFRNEAVEYLGLKSGAGTVDYSLHQEFVGDNNNGAVNMARDFLEHLAVSFSVGPSHYYLVDDLYHMVNQAMEFITETHSTDEIYGRYQSDDVSCISGLTGNYEGTQIILTIREFE